MDDEDRELLRTMRRWILGLIAGVMLLGGGAAAVSRVFDLAWFPWEVKMKTGMIRASNSYLTTQQSALRELRSDYEGAATDAQRAAIARQMHQLADLIPADVQPDIAGFLVNH